MTLGRYEGDERERILRIVCHQHDLVNRIKAKLVSPSLSAGINDVGGRSGGTSRDGEDLDRTVAVASPDFRTIDRQHPIGARAVIAACRRRARRSTCEQAASNLTHK